MTQNLLLHHALPLIRQTKPSYSCCSKSSLPGLLGKISGRGEWAGVGRELRDLADSLGQSGAVGRIPGEEVNTAASLLYSLIIVAMVRNITNKFLTFI